MTCLWVLVALLSAATGRVLDQDETSAPCQPGAVWVMEDGCNSCFCMTNGQPACSFMDCSARDQQSSPGVYKPVSEPKSEPEPEPKERRSGVNCTEGDTWLERCNWCSCLADGEAVCSRIGCDDSDAAPAEAAGAERGLCTPGETFSDGCGQCHCVGSGQAVCSYAACGRTPASRRRLRRRRQAGCTPGTRRQVDCNTCTCLPSGDEGCTRRFCIADQEPSSGAGSQFSSRAGSWTDFGSGSFSDSSSRSGSDCSTEVCPADCGSSRDARGCLVCSCGPDPFFSGRFPQAPPGPSSAAGASIPNAVPFGSRWPWARHDDHMEDHRHSTWGSSDNPLDRTRDHMQDVSGEPDLPRRQTIGGGPIRVVDRWDGGRDAHESTRDHHRHGMVDGSDSTAARRQPYYRGDAGDSAGNSRPYDRNDDFAPNRHYDWGFTNSFDSNQRGTEIRFDSRAESRFDSSGRRGADSPSEPSRRRESVWAGFDASRRDGKYRRSDADGWTSIGRK